MDSFASTDGLISIIIPAYNSEKYIETTLNNIFNQTYQNFEIIVAYDEKSTDNSLEILKNINKNKPIIIDIGRDSSSGHARNRGLRFARGEFVIFVDADDEMLSDYLEKLHQLYIEYPDIEIASCKYLKVTNENINKKRIIAEKSDCTTYTVTKNQAIERFAYGELPSVPWAYLIKRNLIEKNKVIFPDYSHGEDSVFILRTISVATNIGICNKNLYLFRQHSTSVTHTLPNNWEHLFQPSQNEVSRILERYASELKDVYNLRIIYWGIADSVKRYHRYSDFRNKVNQLLKSNQIRKIPPSIEKDDIPKRIAINLFNISKRLYFILHSLYYKIVSTES